MSAPFTRDDMRDAIAEAISDSMDMDWSSRDGAEAVMRQCGVWELYEALDQLHRETLMFLRREGKEVGKSGPGRALYDMVESALAKARGETA